LIIGRSRQHTPADQKNFVILDVYTLLGVGAWALRGFSVLETVRRSGCRSNCRLTSKAVEIFRRGDEIVLREKDGTMVRAFDLLADLPDDLVVVARD
jgi:hypothetical protein